MMLRFLLPLLLFTGFALADESAFNEDGYRRDKAGGIDGVFRTISAWRDIATTARSEAFRASPCETLHAIAEKHAAGEQKLDADDVAALATACEKLLKSSDPTLKRGGARISAKIPSDSLRKLLLPLVNDRNPYVHRAAVNSLIKNPHDDNIAVLLKYLANQQDFFSAIYAIEAIGSKRAREALEKASRAAQSGSPKQRLIDVAIDRLDQNLPVPCP